MTRIALLLLASLAAAHADELRVIYTGKLLGYPRVPDIQRLEETNCAADGTATPAGKVKHYRHVVPPGAQPSAVATLLNDEIAAASKDRQTVLVGLGDNFAMDFFSRISVVKECGQPTERYLAKDETTFKGGDWFHLAQINPDSPEWEGLLEDQNSGKSVIDADNVATFFRNAGYAAIVPGKNDFYYGPERVRQLARLLMGVTYDPATKRLKDADARGVPMLATNMIIRTTEVKPRPVKPDYQREQDRAKQYTLSAAGLEWRLPKAVLPWLRRIVLKGAFASGGERLVNAAEICVQEQPDVKPAPDQCTAIETMEEAPAPAGAAYLPLPTGFVLEGERSYLVCVTVKAAPGVPFCQPFNVHTPFLQFPDNAAPGLFGNQKAAISPEKMRVPPYQYLADRQTVIMGAVAEGLEKHVGSLNTQWVNDNPQLDTGVATIDPTEAVAQLLEHCDILGPCRKARTLILLAQMPRDAAEVLNRQLQRRFHLVVAQADSRMATPSTRVTYESGHPPVVLVPQELRNEQVQPVYGIGLQYVDVTYRGNAAAPERVVSEARRRIAFNRPIQPGNCLVAPFASAWGRLTKQPIPTQLTEEHFRTVVMEAMRRDRRADLTLIQNRDFFELTERLSQCQTTPVASEALRASVEQVLWKGDFVYTRTVRGSALKAAMARSRDIKAKEDDVYSIELERGRWLVAHGLVQNGATWYVNGQALEDNTLYSVAMTDFLAFGETGYAELQLPAVPPAERPRDIARLPRIADAVLDMVAGVTSRPELEFPTYLDRTSHLAFSPGPRATASNRFASFLHDTLHQPQPQLASPAVFLGQTRPYWRLFLDKAEGGFSNYGHNREKQDNLTGHFQGIPESSVLSRKRQTISSSLQLELRREWTRRHFFTRLEEDYAVERAQQDGPFGVMLKNYPFNQISLESGFRFAQSRTNRQRPWFGWLTSFNGSSQVKSPFVDYQPGTLTCAGAGQNVRCPEQSTFRDRTARTSRLLGKAGFFFQGRESWLEAGLFYGKVLRPVQYSLSYGGPGPAVCDLRTFQEVSASERTLSACLTKGVVPQAGPVADWALRANSQFNAERGLFLNFNLRFNLPKRLSGMDQFTLENRGRLFFHSQNDLVIDTHINNLLKLGPVIRIFPSVSLKPTLSLFYFENRVARVSMVGQSFDLKLEYRFNRKSGDSWGQVLKAGWPR